jgi:hypothetical protein
MNLFYVKMTKISFPHKVKFGGFLRDFCQPGQALINFSHVLL